MIGGEFQAGFECVVIAIDTPEYVHNWLDDKVGEIEQVVAKIKSFLVNDLQAQWTLLHTSIQLKFGYWLALQYPSDVKVAATRLDNIIWALARCSLS